MDYYWDYLKKKSNDSKNRLEMRRIAQEEIMQYVRSEMFRALVRDIVIRELNMPQVQLMIEDDLKEQVHSQLTKYFGSIKLK